MAAFPQPSTSRHAQPSKVTLANLLNFPSFGAHGWTWEEGLLGGARDGGLWENTQTFKGVSKQCPPDSARQSRAIHRAMERQAGRGPSMSAEEMEVPQSPQSGEHGNQRGDRSRSPSLALPVASTEVRSLLLDSSQSWVVS